MYTSDVYYDRTLLRWCDKNSGYFSSCIGIGGQLRVFLNHGKLRKTVEIVCVLHLVAVFIYLIFNITFLIMAITGML
jgi:hypothetical protein